MPDVVSAVEGRKELVGQRYEVRDDCRGLFLMERGACPVSHLEIIARFEQMLRMALDIINRQAELLAMHGIETEDGQLEAAERKLREDMEGWC